MNREDIIKMALEAEWHVQGSRVFSPVIEGTDLLWLLERFAALAYAAGAAAEREACFDCITPTSTPGMIAEAIRARGQA